MRCMHMRCTRRVLDIHSDCLTEPIDCACLTRTQPLEPWIAENAGVLFLHVERFFSEDPKPQKGHLTN